MASVDRKIVHNVTDVVCLFFFSQSSGFYPWCGNGNEHFHLFEKGLTC